MFHSHSGVFFEQAGNGAVRLLVKAEGKDDSPVLKDVILDKDTWASIIATVSYHGEEDYGFYRATNFHSKAPIHATTPIPDKPAKW